MRNAAWFSLVKVVGRDCDFWHLEWSYGFGLHMHYAIIALKQTMNMKETVVRYGQSLTLE